MSISDFTIPDKPEELANEDCSYEVRAADAACIGDLDPENAKQYAQGVVYELCSEASVAITQSDLFSKAYSLVSGFEHLDGILRKRLIDSLCSNLSVLGVSANALLASEDGEERDESAAAHASALKAYTFLLWWVFEQAEESERKTQPAAPAARDTSKGGGRTKKKAAEELTHWDWDSQREKILRCIAGCAEVDLWKLFRPANPDSRLLRKWSQLAVRLLESSNAVKNKAARQAAFVLLTKLAHKYQQLDGVAGSLVDLLNKHEHLPGILAELADFANKQHDDARIGVEVLREIASVDPLEYDQQQKDDAAGIRNVSAFVQELAERIPKAVAAHISLLIPHLGGKAHPLRSAIVTAVGFLIQNAFSDPPEEEADAQGAAARLKSKRHLLETLLERARDQSAFTRARVMQTWASLAVSRSIDMGHWLCVTELGVGRLEDKSPYVRKNALQLLSSLLSFNPFAPQLPEDRFVATLEEYKRKLQEVEPEAEKDDEEGLDPINEETNIDTDAEGQPVGEYSKGSPGNPASADSSMQMDTEVSDNVARSAEPRQHSSALAGEIAKLRTTVACMDAAVGFIKAMQGALGTVTQLLASSNLSDVTEAISLLIAYDKFSIQGAKDTLRQMLPLIFSREQGVMEAVLGAIDELCIGDLQAHEAAQRLLDLASNSSLGELSSLEEVIGQMLSHQPALLRPSVLNAVCQICEAAHRTSNSEASLRNVRSGFILLSMVASKQPDLITTRLDLILQVGLGAHQQDALVVRHACVALQKVGATLPPERLEDISRRLVSVVLGGRPRDGGWYSAAEAAIKAIYSLHPAPAAVASAVLQRMASGAFQGGAALASSRDMSRFFFTLGQVAIQHLVHVELAASIIRRQRLAAEKRSTEASSQGLNAEPGKEEDDIDAQVGTGSVAADSELDALKDAAEAQILAQGNLIGQFGKLVMAFCHNRSLLSVDYTLRSSALLALTKLMVLDPAFCDANLQLIFTLLQNRSVEPAIRSNLVIAVGDLAFRFPNVLEPWTHNMYRPLSDPDKGVVKNSLMVLTHLILNDMMKVKGHIARLALCLQDDDSRIAALTQLFFHELSNKAYKGTTPVYNLLPDILSNLSSESSLSQKGFQDIMRHLLQYIGKEKHADSLVDKLCARFESTQDLIQWRNLAFCIAQLNYTEKGIRRFMELLRIYQRALFDDEVLDSFKAVLGKAKKLPKQQADFKSELEAFEEKLLSTAAERKAEEATAEGAKRVHAHSDAAVNDMDTEPGSNEPELAVPNQTSDLTQSTGPGVKQEEGVTNQLADLTIQEPLSQSVPDAEGHSPRHAEEVFQDAQEGSGSAVKESKEAPQRSSSVSAAASNSTQQRRLSKSNTKAPGRKSGEAGTRGGTSTAQFADENVDTSNVRRRSTTASPAVKVKQEPPEGRRSATKPRFRF